MKSTIIILSILCIFNHIVAQKENEYKVHLSIIEKFKIDSVSIKSPPLYLKRLETNAFSNDQVKTPEKSVQAFISFNSNEWGKALASTNYPSSFPGVETLKNRNTNEFIKNIYAKVFFTFYFKYKDKPFAGCYTESYANSDMPTYYTIFVYEFDEGKWLLSDDWYLSRIHDLSMLKPLYASSLIQGKQIEGNLKYKELFNSIYHNNTIDLEVFNFLTKERKDYFSELLTTNSF